MRHPQDEEPLHSKTSLYQIMDHQRRTLQNEIRTLSEQRLQTTPQDQLVTSLADKYSINIPILDESKASPTRQEIDIDMSRDRTRNFLGGPAVVKGTEITISVPDTGDKEVFRFHASSHTMDYPRARIADRAIIFSKRGANLDSAQTRKEFDAWLATIKQHLIGMRTELGNFNDAIKSENSTSVNARLQKIKRDDDLLDGLGFGYPGEPK